MKIELGPLCSASRKHADPDIRYCKIVLLYYIDIAITVDELGIRPITDY
jgi:hypothetical protein